jgi:hypothetical protein
MISILKTKNNNLIDKIKMMYINQNKQQPDTVLIRIKKIDNLMIYL